MNLVFVYGKIISEIEFKFIIESKNYSIAMFFLELQNGSVIKICAYNEKADYCYSKFATNDFVVVEGRLNTNMEINLENISIVIGKYHFPIM